jgi:hypothetical protein
MLQYFARAILEPIPLKSEEGEIRNSATLSGPFASEAFALKNKGINVDWPIPDWLPELYGG